MSTLQKGQVVFYSAYEWQDGVKVAGRPCAAIVVEPTIPFPVACEQKCLVRDNTGACFWLYHSDVYASETQAEHALIMQFTKRQNETDTANKEATCQK